MNRHVKYGIAIIYFFSIIANVAYTQDSVRVLSLEDCIKIGLSQSAQILRSGDSVKITGEELTSAKGQYLPDISFGGNYGYLSGSNLLTTGEAALVYARESQLTYQLSSSINLFSGNSNNATFHSATLANSASQLNFTRTQQKITFDVTQSFLQVILDRRIATYAKKNFDVSTGREAQLQELSNVGRKAMSDLYQQQAETSNDKLFWLQSENKAKNDIILLLRKLKISQTDKYAIGDMTVDSIPFGPGYQNVQNLIALAMAQRPDLQSSALNLKIAAWQTEEFESNYYPKLYLQGGLISNGGYFDELYVNNVSTLGAQEPYGKALFGQVYGEVELSFSWHLFNRLYNKTNVEIAKIFELNNEIEYDDFMVQISSDIKQAYNNYVAALQQIETANKGLFAAEQAFDVISGEYDVGKTDFITLSNAQLVLLQSQVNKAQSDVNLVLQKKSIDYEIGK